MIRWLSNIGNLAKVIIPLLTIGGILIGGIKGYNAWLISKHDKIKVQQEIVTELKSLNVKVDSLVTGQEQMKDLVNIQSENQEQFDKKLDVMKTIMTREFAKTMTPEQVLQMMNDFDTKKNNGQGSMIALPIKDYWIPYSLTSELKE
jgi:low affinity Fe/Cu permease